MPTINDVYSVGVKQHMAFARRRDDKEVVVGRFSCTLKLVVSARSDHALQGDYMTKYDLQQDGLNLTGPKKAQSQVHLLPADDPAFRWRVRVNLRAALDLPLNESAPEGLPSCYAGNASISFLV